MRSHAIRAHTSDIRLAVRADSLEELFRGALEGMAGIMQPGLPEKQSHPLTEALSLAADDTTSLLIDFLSEVLTRMHIRRAIYSAVSFTELTQQTLSAVIAGAPVDGFDKDIKAVTYHEADVKQRATGEWGTTIVFDI